MTLNKTKNRSTNQLINETIKYPQTHLKKQAKSGIIFENIILQCSAMMYIVSKQIGVQEMDPRACPPRRLILGRFALKLVNSFHAFIGISMSPRPHETSFVTMIHFQNGGNDMKMQIA